MNKIKYHQHPFGLRCQYNNFATLWLQLRHFGCFLVEIYSSLYDGGKSTWSIMEVFVVPYLSKSYGANILDNNCVIVLFLLLDSNEDYILQFAPPFNRLELLQAQSCPDAITNHVEQS